MRVNPVASITAVASGKPPAMRLVNADGTEVKTGDIVWGERNSYIFIRHDSRRVDVKTTDDRRMFVWMHPMQLKLRFESL
jgi:hypothetical protein